jgi:hypothetical protein
VNERIKQLAEQAWGKDHEIFWFDDDGVKRFAELVRQDERKACAKIAEQTYYKQIIHYPEGYYINPNKLGMIYKDAASDCAAAIRARGNT